MESIKESISNVFADLGIEEPKEYLIKAKLAYQINKIIQKKKLKQKQAAKLLNVDQPKISALCCGKLNGFSLERLFKFLLILEQDIEIVVTPHKKVRKIESLLGNIFVRFAT